jgi:hypothetical protein
VIDGGCSSAIDRSVVLDWFVAGGVLTVRWTTTGGNGGGTRITGGPPGVFVLEVTLGFNGVIDWPDVAPDVNVFPPVLLPLLPVIPVREPIPDPLPLCPDEEVCARFEPPLKENGTTPKTTTIIGLWFTAENAPN